MNSHGFQSTHISKKKTCIKKETVLAIQIHELSKVLYNNFTNYQLMSPYKSKYAKFFQVMLFAQ